jgi:RHS repeat-associated protein
MPTLIKNGLFGCLALVLMAISALAQDETPKEVNDQNRSGDLPFSASIGNDVERVDIATGHLSISIPFVSLPGRRTNYDLGIRYESGFWSAAARNVQTLQYLWKIEKRPYVTTNGLGWSITQPYLTHTTYREFCGFNLQYNFYVNHNDSYIYHDANGSAHPFDLESQLASCWDGTNNVGYTSITGSSPDTSGVGMWANNFVPFPVNSSLRAADGTLLGANGVVIQDPTGGGAFNYTQMYGDYTDPNGNQKSEYTGGQDSLGRVIVTQQNGANQVLYKYYDSSGTLQTYTVNYSSISLSTHFNVTVPPYGPIVEFSGTRDKVTSIVLPNNKSYSFQYETNGFGGISRIDFPTGAYITYTWGTWSDVQHTYRYVTSRTLNVDGQAYTWNFARTNGNGESYTVTVTDPVLNQQVYQASHGSVVSAKFYNGSAVGTPLRQIDVAYMILRGYRSGVDEAGRLPTSITTTIDGAVSSKIEYDYDSLSYPYETCTNWTSCSYTGPYSGTWQTSRGNVTEIREYDWGQTTPTRRTKKTYLHDPAANPGTASNYLAINIVNKVLTDTVCNGTVPCAGTGDQAAQTQYEYDNYVPSGADANPLLATSGAAQHDYTNFSTSLVYRGNVTRVKRWRNTDGTLLTDTYQYDDLGNIRLIRDPLTQTTSYSYTDSFANASCPPPTGKTGQAWVSQVTNALSQNLQVVRYPCTGLVQAHKDQNDINASRAGTTYTYDLLGRVTQKNLPDGGQVATSYNDVPPVSNTATTKITSTLNHVMTTIMDGLGRQRKTQLTSDPDGTTYTRISYDSLGRKAQEWNPTRCDPDVNPSSCSGEPTFGVTTYSYDGASRIAKVIPPDGTISSNNTTTTYSANTTTITDQAGKARASQTDALGRLTAVFEDPGSAPHLNYETDYQYDVLGNLLRVDQKGGDPNSADWRTRLFTYDSLSRLLTATNPESGLITYNYDADGNLTSKISPKQNQTNPNTKVTLSHCYDSLNRLTSKGYTAQSCPMASPGFTYTYDSGTNGIGRRTSMIDSPGSSSWTYDPMGRISSESRTTASVTKSTSYVYNLDGSVQSITYPSTRVVNYTHSGAARPLSAVDPTGPINYVTAAKYAPQGALYTFTNGGTIGGAMTYNSRLQPLQLYFTAGTVTSGTLTQMQQTTCPTTAATIMSRSYNFGLGTSDNGNVNSISNCRDTNRTQNFTYDAFNRLQTAYSSGPNWGEDFTIDAWGNLTNRAPHAGKTSYEPLSQAALANNQLTGFGYDAAGNMTNNGTPTYTYDVENHMTKFVGGSTNNYSYDGDGQRVKKTGPVSLYWYGAIGEVLDETSSTGALTSEYIFFNGRRVARRDADNSVKYYFSDHLGSASAVTSSAGTITAESDYFPYGGEIVVAGGDTNHYKFTGKERDSESGLDNFGKRYYASSMGRFSSTDPGPYIWRDPQTLNRYTYTRNNPLRYVDPTGMYFVVAAEMQAQVKQYISTMLRSPQGAAMIRAISANPKPNFFGQGTLDRHQVPGTNRTSITNGTSTPIPSPAGTLAGTETVLSFGNIILSAVGISQSVFATGLKAFAHEDAHVVDMNAAHTTAQAAAANAAGDAPSQPGAENTTGGTAEGRAVGVMGELGEAGQSFQPNAQADAQAGAIIAVGMQQFAAEQRVRPETIPVEVPDHIE